MYVVKAAGTGNSTAFSNELDVGVFAGGADHSAARAR